MMVGVTAPSFPPSAGANVAGPAGRTDRGSRFACGRRVRAHTAWGRERHVRGDRRLDTAAAPGPAEGDLVEVADESPEALYAMLAEHGWGDGLPVVAPTPARVERMLAGYPGSVDEVLAVLPPRDRARPRCAPSRSTR